MTTDPHTRARQVAIVVVAAAATLAVLVIWRTTDPASLPDRLATHFGDGGRPNGFMSPTGLFAVALGSTLVGAALAIVPSFLLGWQRAMRRTLAGAGAGVAWGMAVLYLMTLRESVGHADPATVRMGAWGIFLPTVAGLVAGVGVAVLTPESPTPTHAAREVRAADLPRRRLRPDERVVLRTGVGSTSPIVWLTSAGVVVLGVVLATSGGSLAGGLIPIVLGLLMLAAMFGLSLQVDRAGVQVRLLGLPWPVARARLDQIASAEVVDLHPREWGGWGYRITPHGRAVIVRGGAGLVVHLDDGNHLAVSTDDADEAAALVNGLVSQPGRAG